MTFSPRPHASRRFVAAAMLASALLAAFSFWPALRTGFTPEDFGWLVAARQLDSPWPLLSGNVFFVYFYRPLPLLLWWLSAQAFGDHAWAHNALDLVLNALNAALVARLAWRLSNRVDTAWVAGLAFAALPCATGTALWLSDRFDPVALSFGLGALLAFENALSRPRHTVTTGLLLSGALLSKETAYAVAGWLLWRLAWRAWRRRERRVDLWTAIFLPIVLALALRWWTGTAVDTSLPAADAPAAFAAGVIAWWQRFPQALSGFDAGSIAAEIAVGAALVFSVLALRPLASPKTRHAGTLAVTGAALVVATPLLQWPITRLALVPDAGYAVTMNLRFYYLAAAGFALLLGGVPVAMPPAWRRGALFALALLCVGGTLRSRAIGEAWATQFAANAQRHARLSQDLAAREWPAGCRIVLDAPDFDDDFRVHADVIAKSAAAKNASLMHCAVFAGTLVFTTVVDGTMCSAEAWPGLDIAITNAKPVIARLGNLCTLQFAAPPAADDPRALRWRVAADGHLVDPS